MVEKPMRPDQTPVDEAFEDFKRSMREIAERSHPLPADLKRALEAKVKG
jgi:hypothetical protein